MKINKRDKHKHNPVNLSTGRYHNDDYKQDMKNELEKTGTLMTYKSIAGTLKWHRIFGWCKVTHPFTKTGMTLIDSSYKHIETYVPGIGWKTIKGTGVDGCIVAINVHIEELYNKVQDDERQEVLSKGIKIIQ